MVSAVTAVTIATRTRPRSITDTLTAFCSSHRARSERARNPDEDIRETRDDVRVDRCPTTIGGIVKERVAADHRDVAPAAVMDDFSFAAGNGTARIPSADL